MWWRVCYKGTWHTFVPTHDDAGFPFHRPLDVQTAAREGLGVHGLIFRKTWVTIRVDAELHYSPSGWVC